MRRNLKILWIVVSFLILASLGVAQSQEAKKIVSFTWSPTTGTLPPLYVSVNGFVASHTEADEDFLVFQQYLLDCTNSGRNPAAFYNVKVMKSLEQAENEYRTAADKLKEVRHQMEHPEVANQIARK